MKYIENRSQMPRYIYDELDNEMMNFSPIGCTIGNLDTRSKTRWWQKWCLHLNASAGYQNMSSFNYGFKVKFILKRGIVIHTIL